MNPLRKIIQDHETLAGAYHELAAVERRLADQYKEHPQLVEIHTVAAQTLTNFATVLEGFGNEAA